MSFLTFFRRTRPIWILLIVATLIGLLFVSAGPKAPAPPSEVSWPVRAQVVEKHAFSPNTILYGVVESLYETTLSAGVSGYIESLPAKEGLSFNKGESLALINPIDTELEVRKKSAEVAKLDAIIQEEKQKNIYDRLIYQQQEALITLSKKSVERQQELAKQSVASQANIESAQLSLFREVISLNERKRTIENFQQKIKQLEADRAAAQADLENSELNLSRTNIKAPFKGRISERLVSVGDRVQLNQQLISIYDTENLEIRTQFPTSQIQTLQDTLSASKPIQAQLLKGQPNLKVQLDRIAGEMSRSQAGIEALFKIHESNPPLRVGQVVKLKVIYPEIANLISIPFTALYDVEEGYIAYKIIDQNQEKRLKAVGVSLVGEYFSEENKKYMLIESDELQDQDLILITHLPYARDALKVVIREQ